MVQAKKMNEELLKLSINDDLTGLYNRRHFYNKLKEEMMRARRQGRSLFLIMSTAEMFMPRAPWMRYCFCRKNLEKAQPERCTP